MAAIALTQVSVEALKPGNSRREIRDAGSADGLYLFVEKTGGKSFVQVFWKPDSGRPSGYRKEKLRLGTFLNPRPGETLPVPVIGGPLTLAGARQLAEDLSRQRAMGVDVIAERKAAKEKDRDKAGSTFAALAKVFVAEYARPNQRRWKETAHQLGIGYADDSDELTNIKGGLADRWRDKDITTVTDDDLHRIVDETKRKGIPGLQGGKKVSTSRARSMHRVLSKFFGWCRDERWVKSNPMDSVAVPASPKARKRVLTVPEIIWFWRATANLPQPFGPLFRLLLLTGCRLREIAKGRNTELNEDGDLWTIPGSRTKNRLDHDVPLSRLARDILSKTEQKPLKGSNSVFLLFSTNGRTSVSGFSKMKAKLDELMTAEAKKDDAAWPPKDDANFVLPRTHDLRRTCATMLAESPDKGGLGVPPHIVEAVLNHVSGHKSGVAGVYNLAAYLPERRTALQRWAAHVEDLVAGRATNVTPLRKPRKTTG